MKKASLPPPPPLAGTPVERREALLARLAAAARSGGHPPPTLIAVTKSVEAGRIWPLIEAGHRHFGENRVQEAEAKWPPLRAEVPDLVLHGIGRLQSNKAAAAVALFDWIHSVDRPSLVDALAAALAQSPRRPRLLVQVNIGDEPQKGGVAIAGLAALLERMQAQGLVASGLMAVPPADREPAPYFALLARLARRFQLPFLSMGMSDDAELAASLGATHVRVGTMLFGERN